MYKYQEDCPVSDYFQSLFSVQAKSSTVTLHRGKFPVYYCEYKLKLCFKILFQNMETNFKIYTSTNIRNSFMLIQIYYVP